MLEAVVRVSGQQLAGCRAVGLAWWKNIRTGTTPITAVPVSCLLNQD